MKVMRRAVGKGGVSFMEDYTYHLVKGEETVLGAHMLEVCPSIADGAGKPSLEIHPLDIGGKGDPCRLVFNAAPGPSVAASIVDMGGRMRMIVQELDAVKAEHAMPKLPVARALYVPRPDFRRGCQAWLLAGGAHHTVVQPGGHRRAARGPGRHAGHRVRAHRERHRARRAQERAPLERRRLSDGL